MVLEKSGRMNFFAFMSAFSWELWLAIMLTCIGVGVVLWLVDRWAMLGQARRPGNKPLTTLHRQIFRSLGRPMQVSVGHGVGLDCHMHTWFLLWQQHSVSCRVLTLADAD